MPSTSSGRRKHELKKLRVWFDPAEYAALLDFQTLLNQSAGEEFRELNLSRICKQAIFYAIDDAKRRGREMAANHAAAIAAREANDGREDSTVSSGNTETSSSSEAANTNSLADQTQSGDPATATGDSQSGST